MITVVIELTYSSCSNCSTVLTVLTVVNVVTLVTVLTFDNNITIVNLQKYDEAGKGFDSIAQFYLSFCNYDNVRNVVLIVT